MNYIFMYSRRFQKREQNERFWVGGAFSDSFIRLLLEEEQVSNNQ